MKLTSTLLITAVAVSLTACGATTGGLAKSMAKQSAVNAVTSQAQSGSPEVSTKTSAPTVNADMDCEALTAELAAEDEKIAMANETIGKANGTNMASNVAATAASQAALRSGGAAAISKVPFGGLFAKAAMDGAANAGKKQIAQSEADIEAATLRKATLNGLYAGKNCGS